jgi:hypothetical protein
MTSITDATEIFAIAANSGAATDSWFVIVRHLGEERIYATCSYQQYADDVVRGLRSLAKLE